MSHPSIPDRHHKERCHRCQNDNASRRWISHVSNQGLSGELTYRPSRWRALTFPIKRAANNADERRRISDASPRKDHFPFAFG